MLRAKLYRDELNRPDVVIAGLCLGERPHERVGSPHHPISWRDQRFSTLDFLRRRNLDGRACWAESPAIDFRGNSAQNFNSIVFSPLDRERAIAAAVVLLSHNRSSSGFWS